MTRILIVDDEAGIRETLRRFLAQRGFQVSTAATAAEAHAQVFYTPPELRRLTEHLAAMTASNLGSAFPSG